MDDNGSDLSSYTFDDFFSDVTKKTEEDVEKSINELRDNEDLVNKIREMVNTSDMEAFESEVFSGVIQVAKLQVAHIIEAIKEYMTEEDAKFVHPMVAAFMGMYSSIISYWTLCYILYDSPLAESMVKRDIAMCFNLVKEEILKQKKLFKGQNKELFIEVLKKMELRI